MKGTLSLGRELDRFDDGNAIDRGFAAEKSGFARVLIVSCEAEEVETASAADHGINAVIGEVAIMQHSAGIIGEMAAEIAVRGKECGGQAASSVIGNDGVCALRGGLPGGRTQGIAEDLKGVRKLHAS